ncbi:hypothetical protein [Mycobacterium sp.]|uniref:hypothetical protein n=1 Tax=Mycobacterium sp. TaxID=1785 RepID=UPI0025D44B3F|nr:hypothetical protein [Mycobacterium sp.]
MSAAVELLGEQRFELAAAAEQRTMWHAVDMALLGPREAAASAEQRSGRGVEAYSVCGLRAHHTPRLGGFTYENRFLRSKRCERCSWVVALNRGTVEQEIDFYTRSADGSDVLAAAGAESGLLRAIFTAILADAPPGRDAESGHRSDLLAHATAHRPVVRLCEACVEHGPGGHDDAGCPQARVVCGECTFTSGQWAGATAGRILGECVVAAPCSVLVALAGHYGVDAGLGLRGVS